MQGIKFTELYKLIFQFYIYHINIFCYLKPIHIASNLIKLKISFEKKTWEIS